MIAEEEKLAPSDIRATVCQLLRIAPDASNWSEYPNIWGEVQSLVAKCDWYRVYDIAEALYRDIAWRHQRGRSEVMPESFEAKLNEFFEETGVGLKMTDGLIQFRGDDGFEKAVADAKEQLNAADRQTAATEIAEALRDLSRRPEPDRTGAVQHAMAALECLARDLTKDKHTLGEILAKHEDTLGIPEPLHTAVEKAWGFASGRGRHLLEGAEPAADEAEFIVTLCAGLISLLSSRASKASLV